MGNLSYPREGGGKVSLSFAFSSSKPILKGPLSPLPLLHSGASAATHTRLLNSQTTHNPQKEEEEKRDGGGMETARLKNREKSLALQKGSESYFCFCSRQITHDCSICFFLGKRPLPSSEFLSFLSWYCTPECIPTTQQPKKLTSSHFPGGNGNKKGEIQQLFFFLATFKI